MSASDLSGGRSDFICGLNDVPGFGASILPAIRHLLSCYPSSITPTLIVRRVPAPFRRHLLIVAMSLGLGLGVTGFPEVLHERPKALQIIFESPMAVGVFSAILLNAILPAEHVEMEQHKFEREASMIEVQQSPQDEAEQRNAEDSPSNIGRRISPGLTG